jgi:hypothetical protein
VVASGAVPKPGMINTSEVTYISFTYQTKHLISKLLFSYARGWRLLLTCP